MNLRLGVTPHEKAAKASDVHKHEAFCEGGTGSVDRQSTSLATCPFSQRAFFSEERMNNKAIALMAAIGNEGRISDDHAREINAMDYHSFLQSKTPIISDSGIEPQDTHHRLFDWQSQIVKWALRRGRAAIFADCGMGKTLMQIEWARQIGKRVLIVAPLSVAEQTIEEASSVDVTIRFCSSPQDQDGIWITNYQKLHHFIGARYDAIVLDESSILKSLDGKTRTMLIQEFSSYLTTRLYLEACRYA